MTAPKGTRRKKKSAPEPAGLLPAETCAAPPAPLVDLASLVEADGGQVLATYRDPFGGRWLLLTVLPLERVQASPFQRDVSATHVGRLTQVIAKIGRFLDPIIVVRNEDGTYWTPNGNHRLEALRALGARSVSALLLPEREMVYTILALNTEKAHNLKEKALEVIRMARDLAGLGAGSEEQYAFAFEEPSFLTLGICYEKRPRFAGGAYHPVLRRVDGFLAAKLPSALAEREAWAEKLLVLDDRVNEIIVGLKERGFVSPYLKAFVVARVNPLRFQRGATAPLLDTLEKMLAAARKFDLGKVKEGDLAAAGGAPPAEE
jgi:ParB family chromosome partitioning protein